MKALSATTPNTDTRRRAVTVWLALALPPILFFVLIVAASIYFGVAGATDPSAIAAQVEQSTPVLLLIVQVVMLAGLGIISRADHSTWQMAGWRLHAGQSGWREALIGASAGAALGLLYVLALSPLQTWLQQTLGDYVPAGETLDAVGSALVPFFLANVALAPFVEESLYRGYAYAALRQRWGWPVTVVILAISFGLLHWAGGFWYIVLTGIVAGGLFIALRIGRNNLIAPFAAHLALNLVEFVYVWLAQS